MKGNIIENISFDIQVTDNFYVISDALKMNKNSTFIKDNFELDIIEEGFNYDYLGLTYNNCLYLSFTNEYGFELDFLILNEAKPLRENVIKYLSLNVEDEIRRTTVEACESFFYSD